MILSMPLNPNLVNKRVSIEFYDTVVVSPTFFISEPTLGTVRLKKRCYIDLTNGMNITEISIYGTVRFSKPTSPTTQSVFRV